MANNGNYKAIAVIELEGQQSITIKRYTGKELQDYCLQSGAKEVYISDATMLKKYYRFMFNRELAGDRQRATLWDDKEMQRLL